MPLRNHFRSPITDMASWEELHGMWPGVIAMRVNNLLPPEYRSGVKIHLGNAVEVDVARFEMENPPERNPLTESDHKSAREAATPTVLLETAELTPPEYEVRTANLYEDLARRIGAEPPVTAVGSIDATTCRARTTGGRYRIEAWEHALALDSPLPTLPLWISEHRYVPLELEEAYETSCRGLRIQ